MRYATRCSGSISARLCSSRSPWGNVAVVVQEDQARAQQEEKGQTDELKRDEQRLRASRDDIDGKLRDLGALGDTVGELRGVPLATLRKKLAAASREIEKTGSTVNQKAVEEFGDFIEEQKRLTTRGEVWPPSLHASVPLVGIHACARCAGCRQHRRMVHTLCSLSTCMIACPLHPQVAVLVEWVCCVHASVALSMEGVCRS